MRISIHVEIEGIPPQATKSQKWTLKPWVWEREVIDWEQYKDTALTFIGSDFHDMLEGALDKFGQLHDQEPAPTQANTKKRSKVPPQETVNKT